MTKVSLGVALAGVITIAAGVAGCSEDGDTVVVSSGSIQPDAFPGSSVADTNVADDGRAYSPTGRSVSFSGEPVVSWNVSNGQAIGLFVTQSTGSARSLHAMWFDGATWHRPVELHGVDERLDSDPAFQNQPVVWLNTAGAADPNARARNGDAIILFTRQDSQVDPADDEDSNSRAYASYFDVSQARAPASGTVVGGFETLAPAIDHDNVLTDGAAVSPFPTNDPGAGAVGFASDSLHGSHSMGSDQRLTFDSGDPTTFVHLLYFKNIAAGDPGVDQAGIRLWSVQFDLTQAGNTMPKATASDAITPPGLDVAGRSENAEAELTVHDGHVFNRYLVDDGSGSTESVLLAYVFSTAARPTVLQVSSPLEPTSVDGATLPRPNDVYGADHGLASTLFFFEETGFQGAGGAGTRAANRDLMLGELRVASSGATTVGAGSPLEVDGLAGLNDPTNTDGDAAVVRDGVNGAVSTGTLRTCINRTGTALVAVWLQEHDDVTDLDPADGAVGALDPNLVPWVTVVQTRTDAADARTLAESVPAAGAQKSGALESNGTTTQLDAADLHLQDGVAGGAARIQTGLAGAVMKGSLQPSIAGRPGDRGLSFQSEPLRVNWLFTQGVDQASGDADNDRLLLNGLTITLGGTTTPPTFTLTSPTSQVVETLDTDYAADLGEALAVDAGDTTTTGRGRVLVLFPSNGGDELEDTASAVDVPRLFVSEQAVNGTPGAKALLSSEAPTGAQPNADALAVVLGVVIAPVNADTVGTPAHAGRRVHVYWNEATGTNNTIFRLATRSYDLASTTATPSVALASRFVPALGAPPACIDLPTSGVVLPRLEAGRAGSTVGVYFEEDRRVRYQETAGDASGYRTSGGLTAPVLVDNDGMDSSRLTDKSWDVLFPPGGNELSRSTPVWYKHDLNPLLGDHARMFLRVHD